MIDSAVAKFDSLCAEIGESKSKLESLKYIEQAKGLLMKQRNLDEDEAYSLLSRMAMKKNMQLTELSVQLIEAAKMLIV